MCQELQRSSNGKSRLNDSPPPDAWGHEIIAETKSGPPQRVLNKQKAREVRAWRMILYMRVLIVSDRRREFGVPLRCSDGSLTFPQDDIVV